MKSGHRDEGWITGRIYFNREDKRLIVKRRNHECSWTVNLGNKWAWALYIIVFMIVVIICSVL
nr:hypothetical protein [uncultured Acetatifactor sp.]